MSCCGRVDASYVGGYVYYSRKLMEACATEAWHKTGMAYQRGRHCCRGEGAVNNPTDEQIRNQMCYRPTERECVNLRVLFANPPKPLQVTEKEFPDEVYCTCSACSSSQGVTDDDRE